MERATGFPSESTYNISKREREGKKKKLSSRKQNKIFRNNLYLSILLRLNKNKGGNKHTTKETYLALSHLFVDVRFVYGIEEKSKKK
jgi:hypothetical protein